MRFPLQEPLVVAALGLCFVACVPNAITGSGTGGSGGLAAGSGGTTHSGGSTETGTGGTGTGTGTGGTGTGSTSTGGTPSGGSGGIIGSGGTAPGSGGESPDGGGGGGSGSSSGGRTGQGGSTAGPADASTADANQGTGGSVRGTGGSGTAGAGGADPNQIDVYLIGGQSNATGQGYTKNIPASFVVDTRVQLFHSSALDSGAAANTWIQLRHASEPPDAGGDRFGPELGFGTTIKSLYPDRQIGLIKHAVSNTNLTSQWAPGSSATDTSHFGAEFKTFVNTVDAGLKALRAKGMNPIIRGMLWQQGEADADLAGTASAQYGQHLSALIARVRQQWSTPGMLFIYGYVYPASNYGTGRDQVRQGEANVDQDSGNALAVKNAFVIMTDDLSLRANDPGTPYPTDKIHFGTQGQLDLGKRMATKVHDKIP